MLTESRLPSSQEAGENRDGHLVPGGSHFLFARNENDGGPIKPCSDGGPIKPSVAL
jgi:hypothetical protein